VAIKMVGPDLARNPEAEHFLWAPDGMIATFDPPGIPFCPAIRRNRIEAKTITGVQLINLE
jgi:hypothetical protein